MFSQKKPVSSGGQDISTPSSIGSAPSDIDLNFADTFTVVDANIADTNYSRKCQELMALHSELSVLGAGNLLDLPKIVVIGGQSAGKSSLVEAVSGIGVPRDSGTCTRCPMECTMSTSSSEWSCDISLRYEYDEDGIQLSSARTEAFCTNLKDTSSVDLWLRRAQTAILCPHKLPQDFMKKTLDELRTISRTDSRMRKFSRNTIHVEIRDPDATELSFLDLPGLIQNEATETINLVRGLVEDKIGGENSQNTLILVTIPMSDDMENQQAILLARNADPTGERTIGVLTKPDTITTGASSSRKKWKEVIEGTNKAHALKHGYYCVRLSDDDERSRDISRAESQKIAADFFRVTSPWNQIDRDCFGIPIFVKNISELLMGMIENNLPKLKQDVADLLKECQQKLVSLPRPITRDPCAEILLRTTAFCKDLHAAIHGTDLKKLVQKNREEYLRFKIAIRSTAPDFRPFTVSNNDFAPTLAPAQMPPVEPVLCSTATPSGKKKVRSSKNCDDDELLDFEQPKITQGLQHPSDHPHEILNDDEPIPDLFPNTFKTAGTGPLDLSYVRKTIKDSTSWELPGHIPFDATRHIISEFTKLWEDPTMLCFDATFKNLTVMVDQLLNAHFGSFKPLLHHISALAGKGIDACKRETDRMLRKMLSMEKTPVFTQNTHYLETRSKQWLDSCKSMNRYSVPVGYEEELIVMSKVQAYFQVAYKRFIDYIPLVIDHELNQELVSKLEDNLFQTLVKETQARMEELVAEDPNISRRRAFYEDRAKRLVEIQVKLENFRRGSV